MYIYAGLFGFFDGFLMKKTMVYLVFLFFLIIVYNIIDKYIIFNIISFKISININNNSIYKLYKYLIILNI